MIYGNIIIEGLDLMLKGMLGVFVVVGIVYLTMKGLGYIDKRNVK